MSTEEAVTQMVVLPLRCHLFPCTAALDSVLSGRNGTTIAKGLLNVCLIQAEFWDSTHPYLASYATRSQLYQVKKINKNPIIIKGTIESNPCFSFES